MAIVHMEKQVSKFLHQLETTFEKVHPDPQFFDYEEDNEIYKYDEEVLIDLPDFTIEFNLVVTQTGVYDPGDTICQAPEFHEESTEVTIDDLKVYDSVYGEYLRLNREEFTEIINLVRELIII